MCPEKGNKDSASSGAQDLGGVAEGTRVVWSGQEEAQLRLFHSLQPPEKLVVVRF